MISLHRTWLFVFAEPHTIMSMIQPPKIDAVLFDYGLVLSGPPDPTSRRTMESIFGVDEPTFQGAYWMFRDEYDRGTLGGIAYWESISRYLNKPLNNVTLSALIEADSAMWTQPNHAMIKWATTLQLAGIKTGILSNLGDAMESGIRKRLPWIQEFSHHTFSHRIGVSKPQLKIYHHAADGLDVPTSRILFVDDKEENIAAARSVGMVAVQYTSHDEFLGEMHRLGLDNLLSPATA